MALLSRRKFVAGAATVCSAAFSQVELSAKKLKIVVTGGHPGDPEYGCGGTIARYTDEGHKVTLLYLNRGQKGCGHQTAEACGGMRVSEAQRACQILKAEPKFFDQMDGEAIVSSAAYDAFRQLLASENPDVVFTQWPIDNHRDHRAISNLVYDAWLHMGKRFGLYYYEVSDGEDTMMFSPADYVDFSRTESRKRAACFAHASQSPERYYSLQSQITRTRGLESGYPQAEGFIRHVQSRGDLLPSPK
jgi:LmbE family N-acetylglucosaminyl deacetylase